MTRRNRNACNFRNLAIRKAIQTVTEDHKVALAAAIASLRSSFSSNSSTGTFFSTSPANAIWGCCFNVVANDTWFSSAFFGIAALRTELVRGICLSAMALFYIYTYRFSLFEISSSGTALHLLLMSIYYTIGGAYVKPIAPVLLLCLNSKLFFVKIPPL